MIFLAVYFVLVSYFLYRFFCSVEPSLGRFIMGLLVIMSVTMFIITFFASII